MLPWESRSGSWVVSSESLKALESSLELDPNDMSVVVAAAGVAYMAGDKLKSNHYGKMARHLGASEELYRHMEMLKAIRMESLGEGVPDSHDREISELDAAIGRNPGNAALYIARGRARFLKQEDSRAVSDLDAALRLDPSNEAAYVLRGMVYCYMKRYDQVVSNMSEAIRLNPGSVIAHYYQGIAHGELDALDLAVADLTEVIRLEPDHADARLVQRREPPSERGIRPRDCRFRYSAPARSGRSPLLPRPRGRPSHEG